jgi:hypothetical protein
MASSDNRVSVDPEVVHTQSAAMVGQAASLQAGNAGYVRGLGAASPGWVGSSAGALEALITHGTRQGSRLQNRLHGTASGMRSAADGLADQDERNRGDIRDRVQVREPDRPHGGIQAVDYVRDIPQTPPRTPGVPSDPTYPFVGDERFGQWESVPPPSPYVGTSPPPPAPQYRPMPGGTPLTVGPSTGMFTPGKTWIGDIDPPAAQFDTNYRFRWVADQATSVTRVAGDGGLQRWVAHVYEYQRDSDFHLNGDFAGLPHAINFDRTWHPISLPQITQLSANNPDVTFYLPDGCGGTKPFINGAAQGWGAPATPVMIPGR